MGTGIWEPERRQKDQGKRCRGEEGEGLGTIVPFVSINGGTQGGALRTEVLLKSSSRNAKALE